MVTLRGLGWPRFIPINHSESCQSTPPTPVEKSSSVVDSIHQIEKTKGDLRRRSSAGDYPRTLPVLSLQTCTELHSQASSSPLLVKEPEPRLTVPRVEIFRRQQPRSPPALALNSAVDGVEELPHLPQSALEFAQFELGTRSSFDTTVRDLIQSRPDSPIGGKAAAPMAAAKRSFNVGTLVIQGRQAPLIEISSPDLPPCCGDDVSPKRLKVRSNAPDSHDMDGTGSENLPPRSVQKENTDISTPMVTAPESPKVLNRPENNTDIEGPVLPVSAVIDFALTYSASRTPKSSRAQNDAMTPIVSEAPTCEECISPTTVTSNGANLPNMDGQYFSLSRAAKAPGTDAVGKATDGAALPELPVLPGVPTDATGQLTAPGTPKLKKRRKLFRRGQKALRKGRSAMFRTPVLSLIIGRQLAKPTSQALKLISKGIPIDPVEVTRSAPVPAPT